MQIYLVGGAVRDKLLDLPVTDKDWVVVGASPEQLLQQGYTQVGKHFPVFLHPKTKEEYALARTERKINTGHGGFNFVFTPDITLEEDLKRRDLTINAMALSDQNKLIDPYNGKLDLQNKILRHISPAFIEDPLRVLRVCRFAAQLYQHQFTIAPETLKLMQEIAVNNPSELLSLSSERILQEIFRAFATRAPSIFFKNLQLTKTLNIILPELSLSENILKLLDQATKITDNQAIIFGILTYNLNPETILKLSERLKVNKYIGQLAILINKYFKLYQNAKNLTATELLNLLNHLDAFRRPSRLEDFLTASEIILQNNSNTKFLTNIYLAAKTIDIDNIINKTSDNKLIKTNISNSRLDNIKNYLNKLN